MTDDRKPEAKDEVGERVESPVSFDDYEGAWREGRGMSIEEINAYHALAARPRGRHSP